MTQPRDAEPGGSSGPAVDEDGISDLRVAVDRLSRLLASRQAYSRSIEAVGGDVSQQGAMLLTALFRHEGPLTLTVLARHSHIDLSAVSRQLRELERAELVTRAPDPDDARVALVQLTPAGRGLAERLVELRRAHLRRAVAAWPPEKRARFVQLVNEFVDALMSTDI
ncbi:MAG TPA: MarR family transcriptional regulator [Acidimicrobiales bacterium]|nr:MarR family transcriptional regulator [Acidimicrobiales bacterium]